jgi:hypothetical protein
MSVDNLQELYNNISSDYDLPDYDQFKIDMTDPEKSAQLHQTLTNDDWDVPEYNQFTTDLGLKKKDISFEEFQTLQEGVSERPQEFPLKSEALSTQKQAQEIEGKSDLEIEISKLYTDRGGLSPNTKLDMFSKRIEELDQKYLQELGTDPTQEQLNAVKTQFEGEISALSDELGLIYDKEKGSVKLTENDIKTYEDFYERALKKVDRKLEQEKGEKRDTFFKDWAEALDKGMISAGLGLRELGGTLLGLNYINKYKETNELIRQNEELKEFFDETNKRFDQTIDEQLKEGKIGEAFGNALLGATESLPTLMLMFSNPTYGLLTGGLIAANEKQKELEDVEGSELAKMANVVATGLLEIGTEQLTTIPMLKSARRAITGVGKEAVEEAVAKSYETAMQTAFRRMGKGMSDVVLEGVSEAANQYGQNLVEKATLNPEKDVNEGVIDALAIGVVTAGVIKSPNIVVDSRDAAKNIAKEAFNKTPKDASVDTRIQSATLIAEKDNIKESVKGQDPAFTGEAKAKINDIDNAIKVTAQPQTVKETINHLNQQIEEELNQPFPDTKRLQELELGLEQVEQSINLKAGDELKAINSEIESLRKEKDGLYQGEQTEIEIQKDAKREKQINKQLLPLLKQKQAIRNNIYDMAIGDINTEFNQQLNKTAREEGIKQANQIVEPIKEETEDALQQKEEVVQEKVEKEVEPKEIKEVEDAEKAEEVREEGAETREVEEQRIRDLREVDRPETPPKEEKVTKFETKEDFKQKFLSDDVNLKNLDIPMKEEDRISAAKNLREGKRTKQAEILESFLDKAFEDGKIPLVAIAAGGKSVKTGAPLESISTPERQLTDEEIYQEFVKEAPETKEAEKVKKVKEVEEKALEEEKKKRRLGIKALESANLPIKMKNNLINRGIEYVVRGKKVTAQHAKEIAKVFTESGGRDELKAAIMNPTIPIKGDVRTVLAVEFAKESLRLADIETNQAIKDKLIKDATDVFEFDMIESTRTAQSLQAKSLWGEVLGNSPEVIVAAAKAKARKNNEAFLETREDDIQASQDILEQFKNSKEFKRIVEKAAKEKFDEIVGRGKEAKSRVKRGQAKVAEALDKLASKKGVIKNAVDTNQVDEDTLKIIIDLADGLLDIGIGSIEALIDELKIRTREYVRPSDIDKLSKQITEETDAENRLVKPRKIKVPEKTIDQVVDDIYKKTLGATKSQLRDLVRDYIDVIYNAGAIDDVGFKDIFAKALGQDYLTPKQEKALRDATAKLGDAKKIENNFKELHRKYIEAVNKKAPQDEIDNLKENIREQGKEYKRALDDARKANGFISEEFGKENTIGDLFGTFIQGNLLTPISLITNVAANALWIPARGARNVVATGIDAMLYGVGKIKESLLEKTDRNKYPWLYRQIENYFPDPIRTYDAFGAARGYLPGFVEGTVEGLKQMWTGQLPDDVYVRDVARALHPLRAIIENYNSLTGKDKIKANKFILNTLESTLGVPPEIMFRLLNLGDKPFRRGAEKARLSEIAKLKGLKGIERDEFMRFPDEESAEEARQAGLESTFQQDNIISRGMRALEHAASKRVKGKLKGIDRLVTGLLNTLKKSQIPYIKTPSNILIETLDYAVPEWSLAQSLYHMSKGNRRKATDYAARAAVGYMITGAVSTLMGLGLMSLAQGGREDEDKAGAQKIKESEYRNKPAYYINIDALNRYLTGGSPEWEEGDDIVSYKRFGILSSIMMSKAESYRGKSLQEIQDTEFASRRIASLFPVLKSSLDQSFLTGINSALNAATQGGIEADRWLINTTKALTAIALPNTVSTLNKAKDQYIRETRVRALDGIEKNKEELKNVFKSSLQTDSDLPTKVTVWGERVDRLPDGRGVGFMLFDITKKMDYGGDFGVKIHELYERTGDASVVPVQPRTSITYRGERIKLTSDLYQDLQIEVGSAKKRLVTPYVNSVTWDTDTDELRVLKLNKIYDRMGRQWQPATRNRKIIRTTIWKR